MRRSATPPGLSRSFDALRLHYDEEETRMMRELRADGHTSVRPLFTPRINSFHRTTSNSTSDVFEKLYETGLEKSKRLVQSASYHGLLEAERIWAPYRGDKHTSQRRPPWDSATARSGSQHRPRETPPSRSLWTSRISEEARVEDRERVRRLTNLSARSPPFVRHTQASQAKRRPASPARSATPVTKTCQPQQTPVRAQTPRTPRPIPKERLELLAQPKRPVRPLLDRKLQQQQQQQPASTAVEPVGKAAHLLTSKAPERDSRLAPAVAKQQRLSPKSHRDDSPQPEARTPNRSSMQQAVSPERVSTPEDRAPPAAAAGPAAPGDRSAVVASPQPRTSSSVDLSAKRRDVIESMRVDSDDESHPTEHVSLTERSGSTTSSVKFVEGSPDAAGRRADAPAAAQPRVDKVGLSAIMKQLEAV